MREKPTSHFSFLISHFSLTYLVLSRNQGQKSVHRGVDLQIHLRFSRNQVFPACAAAFDVAGKFCRIRVVASRHQFGGRGDTVLNGFKDRRIAD